MRNEAEIAALYSDVAPSAPREHTARVKSIMTS
jgi:hypothetical protein